MVFILQKSNQVGQLQALLNCHRQLKKYNYTNKKNRLHLLEQGHFYNATKIKRRL